MDRTNNYNDLKPFRFWCQKVLPLVYDDSLSYYELLDKVIDYLNKTMEDVTVLNDDTEALYAAYNQLQSYVNNYFDNLDVQQEIDNKLDAMVLDGTLSSLVRPFVGEAVSDWLEDNVEPTGSVVLLDRTMTVRGAAADAEAVGYRLSEKEDILAFDDAPTAGSMAPVHSYGIKNYVDGAVDDIEDEITDLKGDINELSNAINSGSTFDALERLPYAISSNNGQWISGNVACVGIPCTGAKKLTTQTIQGRQTNVAFLKSYNPSVGTMPDLCDGQTGRFNLPVAKTTYSIPSDCNYIYMMIMNTGNDYTPVMFEIDGMDYVQSILRNLSQNIAETQTNEKEIANNTGDIQNIKEQLDKQYKSVSVPYTITDGYYYTKTGAVSSPTSGFCLVDIDVTDVIAVKIYGYQATVMAGLFFVDENGNAIPDKNGDIYHLPTVSGYNTIELEKPYGAVMAKTSFSVSSGRTYSVNGFAYVFGDSIEMPSLTDVLMIPIFGQSLSIGAASTPTISVSPKYEAGIMFNGGVVAKQKAVSYFTDFLPLSESTLGRETVASGCVEKIVEQVQSEDGLSVVSSYWNNHHVLMVSCGEGSKTIADLVSEYYDGLKNAVQGAKNICDSEGLSLSVPCWIWMQGETDQKEDTSTSKEATSAEAYTSSLVSLQTNFNTYVKSVTGQSNDIKCICYQCGAQNIVATTKTPSYTNVAVMGVPTAQMRLVRDNDLFVASAPVYILDHSTAEPIHLANIGEKMLGLFCGLASKAVIFGEESPTGLLPVSYEISGNTLKLTYDVPVPPLRLDTSWVKEVSNYGFALFDSNNTNIITSISVFDDTVMITCSSDPTNAMLFYGFNGSAYRDGRKEGSRGNLCDSAQYIFNGEIGGKRYTLSNYAYSFVKFLDSASGVI